MLGGYDGEDHVPKLIPCSHTVCVSCLQVRPSGSVRRLSSFFPEDRCYGQPPAGVQVIPLRSAVFPSCLIFYLLRCPICRELIRIPPGGVMAFPPSFLVNQLIDLMARQTREVVPNCSQHENQVNNSRFNLSQQNTMFIRCHDNPLDNEDTERIRD